MPSSHSGFKWLIFATVSLAVVLPFLWLGIPSGHDFEFHLNSWMEVQNQWHQGIVYPRWADLAHSGYGEARFLFYPPASWILGALLGEVLPWKLVPGVYIWIALTLAGISMHSLARRWMEPRDAIVAACLYTVNPYFLIIVYWRSAYAELLAGVLLPLLLLFVLRLEKERWRAAVPLALIVAAAWLTNAPSAVMLSYSLVLLLAVLAFHQRSPRIFLYGIAAMGVGLALAAFYVLPAAYEQKWIDISQVLSPGVRPQDNFLFTTISDADHNRFNHLVSVVAAGEIFLLVAATFWAWKKRAEAIWLPLVIWGTASTLLMFSFTSLVWNHLPKLAFIQLPWRWLLCLNVALTFLIVMAWRQWWLRFAAYTMMLALLFFVWHWVQPPWWDKAADIAKLQTAIQTGQGYEGTDEYVPLGADPYEIKSDARRVTLDGPGKARILVLTWNAKEKSFTAEVTEPTRLALRLFNYPAWQVSVNGRIVETDTQDETGQMVIPVGTGQNEVRVMFMRTWDRTVGGWISVASVVFLGVVILAGKNQKR